MIDRFQRRRRPCRAVRIGPLTIGGGAPVLVQSMTTTTPSQIAAGVAQCRALHEAGCPLVRFTTPTAAEAEALGPLRAALAEAGLAGLPLVADVHFQPAAATAALAHADKVRVNPGNFADRPLRPGETWDDARWASEQARAGVLARAFFADAARRGRAVRIGVNHGSLSARLVHRHGDTAEGMVESALEYARFAVEAGCRDLVVSLKTSNPLLAVRAGRLLAHRLDAEGLDLPLHLGVTEAGIGRDGRIKGAAGMGALLADGLGDTLRLSLAEAPEAEIAPALAIAAVFAGKVHGPDLRPAETIDPLDPQPRPAASLKVGRLQIGGTRPPLVFGPGGDLADPGADLTVLDLSEAGPVAVLAETLRRFTAPRLLALGRCGGLDAVAAYRLLRALIDAGPVAHPLCLRLDDREPLAAAARLGALLADGLGEAVWLPELADGAAVAFAALQAMRRRITTCEFIACPGCGRTRFDLVRLAEEVRDATRSMTGLTVAVMGCVVNGPGEMAGADYGLLGEGDGTLALYCGREPVERRIPQTQALARLLARIAADGRSADLRP